jgi:hypothetical protein
MNCKFLVNLKKIAIEILSLLSKVHREAGKITSVPFLTLSLLMSYIYGAPSKARNLTSYIYIYMDDIFSVDFAS